MPAKQPRLDTSAHQALARWAADCAEHVLPHFEQAYPDDARPRQAVAAVRAWVRGELTVSAARLCSSAAHAAARAAEHPAARAAARAAGQAAGTAHAAGHAAHAAAYAIAAAGHAAAATATAAERAWQDRRRARRPTRK